MRRACPTYDVKPIRSRRGWTGTIRRLAEVFSRLPSPSVAETSKHRMPSIARTSATASWQISPCLIPLNKAINGIQNRERRGRFEPRTAYPFSSSRHPRYSGASKMRRSWSIENGCRFSRAVSDSAIRNPLAGFLSNNSYFTAQFNRLDSLFIYSLAFAALIADKFVLFAFSNI